MPPHNPVSPSAINDKSIILLVVAGFLLMQVTVGLAFRRFSKNTSDYFRAGGQATWWLLGGSAFMQSFSAWVTLQAASLAEAQALYAAVKAQ